MVRCSECGKEFSTMGTSEWTYRVRNASRVFEYQCSYKCWRERTKGRFDKYETMMKEDEAARLWKEKVEDSLSR